MESGVGKGESSMASMTKAAWEVLSPLLDELLVLGADRRPARLAEIRLRDSALADELDSLLSEQSAIHREAFLEGEVLESQDAPTLEGQSIGPYTLERPLGRGGMGAVWLARRSDGRFEGKVAVKFLNLALLAGGGAKRFQREGNILARLAHPNIARLLDAGVTAGGQPYLVLEYIEGEPIDRYCDSHALDVRSRIRLFLDVVSAVAEAHRNLILHRDITPANILVTTEGRVKLLDFGIAKLLESEDVPAHATELTQHGGRAFTPSYAAPEQIEGGSITTATDVHALGVLLYVLLAGRHPTLDKARSSLDQLKALVQAEPMPLSEAVSRGGDAVAGQRGCSPRDLARALRGDLENVVAKALRKNPTERYATVTALETDLRNHLAGRPVSARVDDRWYRARKFVVRNRAAVAAAAAIGLTLVAGAGIALWQASIARAEARRAQEINRFVLSLFRSANPSESLDSGVRAVDLLKQAQRRIESELAGRPDLQAELLATVGSSLYELSAL
ncbi:MAG TPA: serine/threonine-protein kinase, partial [Myxococcales bacterium]|nr:serine/threonine-protein kinase [Myxococcales bacterium]